MEQLVSIITVCYNSEKTIRRTIESVLDQTYKNIEYIIIDGKSTDNTIDIVNEYKECFGEKLIIVSEPDSGIYDAMNKGIALAKGNVIGIINSDDYYERNAVETIVRAMKEDTYQIIYGMLKYIKDETLNSIYLTTPDFLEQRPMCHPSCFVTKSVYEDFGGYDTKYKYVSDYEFCLRMKNIKSIKFVPVYEILACFTEGGVSYSYRCDIEALQLKREKKIISTGQYILLYVRRMLGHLFGF